MQTNFQGLGTSRKRSKSQIKDDQLPSSPQAIKEQIRIHLHIFLKKNSPPLFFLNSKHNFMTHPSTTEVTRSTQNNCIQLSTVNPIASVSWLLTSSSGADKTFSPFGPREKYFFQQLSRFSCLRDPVWLLQHFLLNKTTSLIRILLKKFLEHYT